jgi:pimeloyl-ACP methyl ester carboxylesterase
MSIEIGGRRLGVTSAGDGTAFLLLHAFPLSAAMWTETATALSSRCRVITVDARGFGGSAAAEGPLTMDSIAEDAVAVLDHFDIRTAIVGGCSMGGYAAFAFARRFADRLAGLVLVDTRAAADTDEGRAGRMALAEKVSAHGSAAAAEAMIPKLLGATTHRERPKVVARVRDWTFAARPAAIVSGLHGLAARPDSRPMLGTLQVPALIVRGEEDAIIGEGDAAEMHVGIAGSQTVSIPHAGHLPNLEAPERFTAALADFLARCGA